MINGVREKISLFKQPQALKGPSWLMSGGQAAYTPALVGLEIVVPLEEPFTAGCFCALRRKLCRERAEAGSSFPPCLVSLSQRGTASLSEVSPQEGGEAGGERAQRGDGDCRHCRRGVPGWPSASGRSERGVGGWRGERASPTRGCEPPG